jgi:hypothetical protein
MASILPIALRGHIEGHMLGVAGNTHVGNLAKGRGMVGRFMANQTFAVGSLGKI